MSGHPFLAAAVAARTHRVCAPEHVSYVRTACLYDRSVLPRWHQDDRGDRNAHRGVHYVAPAGAYRQVRVWNGRQHWLTFVVPVAIALARTTGGPHGEFAREELSPDTFALWARVESGYAQDQRTGRRCIVRPATVASVMGVQPNTVRKCRRVARRLGLQVVISMGRMLTSTECWAARRRGSSQRGLSTETALTIPSACAAALMQEYSDTPTSGRSPAPETHRHSPPLGASARIREAAPPPLRPKRRPQPAQPDRSTRSARPAATRRTTARLAYDLIDTLPWLRTESPSRLIPALTRFATTTPAWTAQDLLDAITTLRAQRGLTTTLTADTIKTRPAVVLAAFLRQLHHHDDHPRLPHLTPDQLRCHQPTCDHGWIT
ncbi:MAG: hypothetical protein ABI083_16210, partial [Lapillicoccus sp.]